MPTPVKDRIATFSMLEDYLKRLVLFILRLSGLARLSAWWQRHSVLILCYHSVTESTNYGDENDLYRLHLNRRDFIAQIEYLQQNYHVISLREYLTAVRAGQPLPPYSVVLTFDDGYRNFLTVAAPLLAERQLPATLFLITGNMNDGADQARQNRWLPTDDGQSISWIEAESLARGSAIELGSHTCSHPNLTAVALPSVRQELSDSYGVLAAHTDSAEIPFAYPCGQYTDEIAQEVRLAGYSCALTTDEAVVNTAHDLFALPRRCVCARRGMSWFIANISGLLDTLRPYRSLRPAARKRPDTEAADTEVAERTEASVT